MKFLKCLVILATAIYESTAVYGSRVVELINGKIVSEDTYNTTYNTLQSLDYTQIIALHDLSTENSSEKYVFYNHDRQKLLDRGLIDKNNIVKPEVRNIVQSVVAFDDEFPILREGINEIYEDNSTSVSVLGE